MIFQRIKSPGLAHHSYFIGSEDTAAVIDPRRDCDVYIKQAQQDEVTIKYIFETHRNEDYVIGSAELSYQTGAEIYHGPCLEWKYGTTLRDGATFQIGKLRLTVLHTPGHTDESMSYVLADREAGEEPVMVFTGDALFIGDMGRTDLYGPEEAPRLASALYESIFNKLLSLGDGVILCPAHGAGSVCGSHISAREESTLGIERLQNPLLHMTNKDDFVTRKVHEYHERPPYFRQMEKYNLEGAPLLRGLPIPPPLSPREFKDEMERGAVVVDARTPPAFGGAHIKSAYSIWLEGIPGYAGWVLPYETPLLLVLECRDQLETAVHYLLRLGYDNIIGYLKGGIAAWYDRGFTVEQMGLSTVHELKYRLDRHEDVLVLDVRDNTEWKAGHIEGAHHIFVGHLQNRLAEIPRDRPITVLCSIGHRASLAPSILLRAGFSNVCCDVLGSMRAWNANQFPAIQE
ncbi:MAG: MBL fold metallo-hydrolase [Methanomicrobia archaeon]|nr:MBL fold metallo-hydrolase [Methanomicrobia archaeon]